MKNKIAIVLILLGLSIQLGYAKNTYGVVIGCCGDYENNGIKGLNAKKDAQSFYNNLLSMYYHGNSNSAKGKLYLLTETEVTRENIKKHLKRIAKKAKSGDVVYFFYSGHGSSLHDKSSIIAPAYRNNQLIKVMENSGLIVPYNFDFNHVGKTAIIGKRDLKDNEGYGFKYLDNKGVQVIMISDSCFSGNLYRNSSQSTSKFIPKHKLNLNSDIELAKLKNNANKAEDKSDYKHLVFFSAGGTDKAVAEDHRLKRGKFSLVVEKCLETANSNNDSIISKKEFQECLHTEDTAKAFIVAPYEKHLNLAIFKAKNKNITIQEKDKIRVKTSIRNLAKMSDAIIIDNKNYDIEIVRSGNGYVIFRYTGEKYARVERGNLKKYLNSFKLFKLNGKAKLEVKVLNKNRKEMGRFCKGEKISVEISGSDHSSAIVAITLDREGKVIMLQPNDKKKDSSSTVSMKVQYPFGMDKFKVFALNNKHQYKQIKTLVVKGGVLEDYAVDKLYKILKRNKDYKEVEVNVETLDRPVSSCRQGD